MSLEQIIATPFGYIMDGLLRLTSNYGVTIILFAIIVQLVMYPINRKNRSNAEKKRRLKPIVAQIRKQYKDNPDKQTDEIASLYDREKLSLAGSFILNIIPFFILIPIFQAVAQPITYIFHETPETASAIINAIYEEAPEVFSGCYHQVAAISHIRDFAEIVKEKVPEVSARTLEGLNYGFLGLDLAIVPGDLVLGKGAWAWDWAHIGAISLPIIYYIRRIYLLIAGMVRSAIRYNTEKRQAAADNLLAPPRPKIPFLDLFFLVLSITVLFTVPVGMNLYWLACGLVAAALKKLEPKKAAAPAVAEMAAEVSDTEH